MLSSPFSSVFVHSFLFMLLLFVFVVLACVFFVCVLHYVSINSVVVFTLVFEFKLKQFAGFLVCCSGIRRVLCVHLQWERKERERDNEKTVFYLIKVQKREKERNYPWEPSAIEIRNLIFERNKIDARKLQALLDLKLYLYSYYYRVWRIKISIYILS